MSRLHELDWVVTEYGRVLHSITLADQAADELEAEGSLPRPLRLLCGRRVNDVWIPDMLTRLTGPRCRRCCRIAGIPEGVGSPKNDPAVRAQLGWANEGVAG